MKLICLSVFALTLSAQTAPPVVGSVKIVRGGSSIHRGTQVISATEGLHLLPHDSLHTSADGALGVILQDGTRVSLGPNTILEIDQFTYEPVEGRFALLLRLARGIVVYISGRIAEFSPGSIQVETPVGILGLRGTELAISLEG